MVSVNAIYDVGMPILLAVLSAVVLASPFGLATASAIDDSDGLTVEVTVQFSEEAEAMIARPFSDFEELPPTALTRNGDEGWIGWVELPTAQNWKIAFEAFRPDGEATLSEGSTLIELGVDVVVIESEVEAPLPSAPLLPEGSPWLIAGVISMVAALILLAFWTFGSWGDTEAGDDDATEAGRADDDEGDAAVAT